MKRSFKPNDEWYENEHRELMQLDASNTKESPMFAFNRGKTTNQNGYITEEVMACVAEVLEVSVMKVKDVVTFYPMFFEEPVGKYVIRVCHTLPCALRDCKKVLDHLKKKLDVDVATEKDLSKGTTSDGRFTLMKSECLASCDVAPVVMINDDLYKNLTLERVDEVLDSLEEM